MSLKPTAVFFDPFTKAKHKTPLEEVPMSKLGTS